MHAAAKIAYHFRLVQGLADRMLSQMPVWDNPQEQRYTEILHEKRETIEKTLEELKKIQSMNENLHSYFNIVYKADETDKLLFEQWKRLAEQNKAVDQEKLKSLDETMKRMKKELEKAVPAVEELAGGWIKMRFIVPALYRETAKGGEEKWTEER